MRDTVVSVAPTTVEATIVDGRVSVAVTTTAGQVDLQRTPATDDAIATWMITSEGNDLDVTATFAPADVTALAAGFATIDGGGDHG